MDSKSGGGLIPGRANARDSRIDSRIPAAGVVTTLPAVLFPRPHWPTAAHRVQVPPPPTSTRRYHHHTNSYDVF